MHATNKKSRLISHKYFFLVLRLCRLLTDLQAYNIDVFMFMFRTLRHHGHQNLQHHVALKFSWHRGNSWSRNDWRGYLLSNRKERCKNPQRLLFATFVNQHETQMKRTNSDCATTFWRQETLSHRCTRIMMVTLRTQSARWGHITVTHRKALLLWDLRRGGADREPE